MLDLDGKKCPQRCSSFEAVQHRHGDISLSGNHHCLDPINDAIFYKELIINFRSKCRKKYKQVVNC